MKHSVKKAIACSAACLVALSAPALVSAAEMEEIEEIVVTANKRAQNLSDISYSVQALNEDDLRNTGVTSILDLTRVVPGLSATSTFNATSNNLGMRGVRGFVGHDSPVGFYMDESPITMLGYGFVPSLEMFDVERVEVLKGPQGTLYGASSLGGAIKVITNEADASAFGGSVRLSGYNTEDGDDSYSFDAALNVPLIQDVLAVRLVHSRAGSGWFYR